MVFSSSTFLFAFLPAFLALYFVFPWRTWRNAWLLAASLVFYAWGEPVYVWLMVAAIVANWAFGLAIGRARGRAGEGRSEDAVPGAAGGSAGAAAGPLDAPGGGSLTAG